jgi:hypothetical protein
MKTASHWSDHQSEQIMMRKTMSEERTKNAIKVKETLFKKKLKKSMLFLQRWDIIRHKVI